MTLYLRVVRRSPDIRYEFQLAPDSRFGGLLVRGPLESDTFSHETQVRLSSLLLGRYRGDVFTYPWDRGGGRCLLDEFSLLFAAVLL